MKKILFLALGVASVLPLWAGRPNSATRAVLGMRAIEASVKSPRQGVDKSPVLKADNATQQTFISTIVEMTSSDALASMEALGCVIFGHREELALVCVPESAVNDFLSLPNIGEISVADPATVSTNRARAFSGVDNVHTYNETGYDGTGVVVGLTDIGFDATHPAFAGRVNRFSHHDDTAGSSFRLETEEEILAQGTDNPTQTHATMCANILGGSREASEYYGMAPGADMVVSTSILHDCGILAGIDEIIDYAQSKGKPAVLSMSLASLLGPHDGTDLFCRYLDKQGLEATIAVSAGNAGNLTPGLRHEFTETDTEIVTAVVPRWGGKQLNGRLDIWNSNSTPFKLTIEVWDFFTSEIVYTKEISDKPTEYLVYTANDPDGFGQWYKNGGISASIDVQPCNNRYAAMLSFLLECDELRYNNPRYFFLVKVEGRPGTVVEMYSDCSTSTIIGTGNDLITAGDASLTISNFACAHNILAVGSVTGVTSGTGYAYNTASPFSSYAPILNDGRSKPDILAPGVQLVTAQSSYLTRSRAASDDVTYSWVPDDGTSFSAPVAAGIMALWQQANPNLQPADLRKIAMETASKDLANPADPRTGHGKIDAMSGLYAALNAGSTVGVDNISGLENPIMIFARGREILATCPGMDVRLEVFTLSGAATRNSDLTPGMYIARAYAGNSSTAKLIHIQ